MPEAAAPIKRTKTTGCSALHRSRHRSRPHRRERSVALFFVQPLTSCRALGPARPVTQPGSHDRSEAIIVCLLILAPTFSWCASTAAFWRAVSSVAQSSNLTILDCRKAVRRKRLPAARRGNLVAASDDSTTRCRSSWIKVLYGLVSRRPSMLIDHSRATPSRRSPSLFRRLGEIVTPTNNCLIVIFEVTRHCVPEAGDRDLSTNDLHGP